MRVAHLAAVAAVAACAVAAPAAADPPRELTLGSRGADVAALQRRLVGLRYLGTGATGVFDTRTWNAVVALQGWSGLVRDGIVGPRTRAALTTARPPAPWGGLRRGLELDLRRQVLLVVDHGTVLRAVHASTAAPGYVTPVGRFPVYARARRSWSVRYRVWLDYALYFFGGHAIHGYPSVPAYPASHGCVRLPLADAAFVYAHAPLRTPVWVRSGW